MRRWQVAWTATAVACGAPCPEGPASIEIGTGDVTFTAITDGDDVPFVAGPQGGWHVFGSVRATGMAVVETKPDDLPVVTFQVIDPAEGVVAGFEDVPRAFRPSASADGELIGELVIFLADPSARAGDTVALEVTVTDRCGNTATDARDVVLVDGGA